VTTSTLAAVSYSPDRPLEIEEVHLDPPGPGEVQVRVTATAICHSDISFFDGSWGAFEPAVFGHETAGVVSAVGDGVSTVAPGDSVVVTLVRYCGECFFCQAGEPTFCVARFLLDEESRLHRPDGAPLGQGLKVGGFAGEVVAHASQVIPVPPDLAPELASLLACGVLTGVGAVTRTARVEPGAAVAVIGVGGVGLNVVQGARIAEAAQIIAVDLAANKLEAAVTCGATDTVDATVAVDRVRELTDGRGADVVFVAAGSGRAIDSGLAMMRRGGSLCVVGMPANGVATELELGYLAAAGQRIIGSKMGSAVPAVDIPWLVSLHAEGRLDLETLVTHSVPLADIATAVAEVRAGAALRNVISFAD
jgi:S-(hydroxymethyl)glutathione dehydrogenase / alcohol dehydrogenase